MKEKFDFPEINVYAFATSDIVTISWTGKDDNVVDGGGLDNLDATGAQ